MSDLAGVFDVLMNNNKDIEDVIQKFGGIGNVIRAAPSLLRIMQTLSKHKDSVAAAERAANAIIYSEETRSKVEDFQRKHGLDPDGLVGDFTWGKVEALLAAKNLGR